MSLEDALSAAASNDLRLLQRDIDAPKERQIFPGQLIKEQRIEFSDWIKSLMAFVFMLVLANFTLIWQILPKNPEKKTL